MKNKENKRWKDPKQKALAVYLPMFIYEEIEELQPYLANTITSTIIRILERGIAYYQKSPGIKRALANKGQQNTEHGNPQENNNLSEEQIEALKEIAKVPWAK